MSDYFDELNEAIKEESQGSGGIIALTTCEMGFKIYASNDILRQNSTSRIPLTQAMTFFPTGTSKADREKAKNAAKVFAAQVGAREPRNLCIRLLCQKEGALSKGVPVTWKVDREFVEEVWENAKSGQVSDGAKVVKPALKAIGLPLPWTHWAQIGFTQSPSGRKDKDEQGNERTALIAYPACVFASEAEAKAGVTPLANGTLSAEKVVELKTYYNALINSDRTPELAIAELVRLYGAGEHPISAEQVKAALA